MTMTKKPEITIDADAILAAIRDGSGLTSKDGALMLVSACPRC